MTNPLAEVLDKISASSKLPIVVFDLDDTLFATARRNLTIIQNFAADCGEKYPQFAEVAWKMGLSDMNWSSKIALVNAGLDENDPSISAFHDYWGPRFFSDRFTSLDLPNPGAVDYVKKCYEGGALIYYLTGRHASEPGMNNGMGQGTTQAMTDRGFPFWQGRCELNLKIEAHEKDEEYKGKAIKIIQSLDGNVIATFDNEPRNAALFQGKFPDAMNFWVKTTWDPNDDANTDELITISDFKY